MEKAYKWSELSDIAKARATDVLTSDQGQLDYITESFIDGMKAFGADVRAVYYSISYSQSDYATFVGYIDMRKWLTTTTAFKDEGLTPILLALMDQRYVEHTAEVCIYSRSINRAEVVWPPHTYDYDSDSIIGGDSLYKDLRVEEADKELGIGDYIRTVEAGLALWVKGVEESLYRQLRDELDYLRSDEAMAELCEANDYRFSEFGLVV